MLGLTASTSPSCRQKGFTLIEVMIVVVIIGILMSAMVLTIKPKATSQIRQTLLSAKDLMVSACDRAAFEQRVYLIVPSPTQLQIYKHVNQKWQAAEHLGPITWPEGLEVDWQRPETPESTGSLVDTGWRCWPGGEMTPGSLRIRQDGTEQRLKWNEIREFDIDSLHE